MSILQTIIDYIAEDPVTRIMVLAGGATSIIICWKAIVNRARIRIYSLSEHSQASSNRLIGHYGPHIQFEVENRGGSTVSLEPAVTYTAFDIGGKKIRMEFTVEGNLSLDHHVPTEMTAKAPEGDDPRITLFIYQRLRTYTFKASRGRSRRVRVMYAGGRPVSRFRYYLGRLLWHLGRYEFVMKRLEKSDREQTLIPPR
jgi:hypothetical protein